MKFDKLTIKAQEAIAEAQSLAQESNNQVVDIPHVLIALLAEDGIPGQVIAKLGANLNAVRGLAQDEVNKLPKVKGDSDQVYLSRELSKAFKTAEKEAKSLGDEYLSTEHLLLGIVQDSTGELKNELKRLGITRDSILNVLKDVRGNQNVTSQSPEDTMQSLDKYGKDFTELARQGKIDPVIGRDDEIRRVIQVLSRRTKNKAYSLKKVSFEENKTFNKSNVERFINYHKKKLRS